MVASLRNFSIKKKGKNLLKILAGIVIALIILFILNVFVAPVKNLVYIISSPIQKVFWQAGESSSLFFSSFLKDGFLIKENEDLRTENQKLLSQVAILQSITEGNKAQSDVSASCQNRNFNLVMAGIVGLDDKDILSINKGSDDGITEDMPVINSQNVLFGRVFKVYNNFSQILLVSNKESVTNVKVFRTQVGQEEGILDEVDGVVRGAGGLAAYLDLVPVSSDIKTDEVLVTSSIDKSFPKDLLVGKIIQPEKNDQNPFQQAKISLFLDIGTADNLFVITNYKQVK